MHFLHDLKSLKIFKKIILFKYLNRFKIYFMFVFQISKIFVPQYRNNNYNRIKIKFRTANRFGYNLFISGYLKFELLD